MWLIQPVAFWDLEIPIFLRGLEYEPRASSTELFIFACTVSRMKRANPDWWRHYMLQLSFVTCFISNGGNKDIGIVTELLGSWHFVSFRVCWSKELVEDCLSWDFITSFHGSFDFRDLVLATRSTMRIKPYHRPKWIMSRCFLPRDPSSFLTVTCSSTWRARTDSE